MTVNTDWHRRLISLDQQLGGKGTDVADVRIVQQLPSFYSRERAPTAQHWMTVASPGAGLHNGLFLSGSDTAAPLGRCGVLVHGVWFSVTGNVSMGLVPISSLTLNASAAVTPINLESDPEVTPLLTNFSIATAQIPAGTTAGWTDNGVLTSQIFPAGPPFQLANLRYVAPDQVLIIINNDDDAGWNYRVHWQATRL